MKKFVDYSKAKLLLLYPSQVDKVIKDNALATSGANGYVLVSTGEEDQLENMLKIRGYGTSIKNAADRINKLYEMDNHCSIWVSTPAISYETISYININNLTEKKDDIIDFIYKYLTAIQAACRTAWDSCVKGIYYNQESIYCENFAYGSNIGSNFEVQLMSNITYKIRNNLNIGCIWMPYLPVRDVQNSTEGELFHRIGTIISYTNFFDCACLQPGYTTIDNDIAKEINNDIVRCEGLDSINYSADTLNMVKESSGRKRNAIANMKTLRHTLSYNTAYNTTVTGDEAERLSKCLFYRANQDNKYLPTSEVRDVCNCLVGVVMEYNLYLENGAYKDNYKTIHSLLGIPYEYDETLDYQKYFEYFSKYVDKKPIAFYWHNSDKPKKCMAKAKELFNPSEYSATGSTLSDSGTTYLACIAEKPQLIGLCNTIHSNFLSPGIDGGVYHSFGPTPIEKEKLTEAVNYSNELLHATYPQMYWFSDIKCRVIESSDNLVSKVYVTAYTVADDMDDVVDKYSAFNSATDSIVTLLKDTTLSPLDQFIKIHDWLTNNVVYTTEQTDDYSSAYGAVIPAIRRANSRGFSAALTLLCQKMDIACVPVHGFKNNEVHSWNYVNLGGSWQFVDASLNTPSADDAYRYRYFLRERPISYVEDGSLPTPVVSEETYIKFGNIDNSSEVITSNDAALLSNYLSNPYNFTLSPSDLIAADVDGNGILSSNDVSCIYQKIADSSYELPVIKKLEEYP